MKSFSWISLALLAACVPSPVVQRPSPAPRAEDVLAALEGKAARLHSLRSGARIEHTAKGERVKLGADLLVAHPGKLRFEAHVTLQGTVATLVSDGTTFSLLDAKNDRFYTGPAKGCNVARLIGIDLEPELVVSALLGQAPGLDRMRPVSLAWDPSRGGHDVLTLEAPDGGRLTLRLDGRNQRWDLLEAERRDARDQVSWRIENDGWHDVGGVRRPQRTHVEQPPIKVEVFIKFREQEPNVEPKEGVFQLQPPVGIRVEHVDC